MDKITRRGFIGRAATLAAALGVADTALAQRRERTLARDGVQIYWFTQLADREGKPFEEMLPGFLADTATAGFSGVDAMLSECATDEGAERFSQMVGGLGLEILALYSGGALHAEEAASHVERILSWAGRAKPIGCPGVNLNPDPIGREKTNAELATQASALDDLGAGLREKGLWLGIHTHAPEMSHNAREFRFSLERTDPRNVGLCADFHWMYRGGGDPYALTREYAERIVSTHLRNSQEGVWAECFCEGDLDYGRIRGILDDVGYEGDLCVEVAWEARTPSTRTPLENLKLSREYLRKVFGV